MTCRPEREVAGMTRARKDLIDPSHPGTYHLITRCVRRERLLDRGERKVWLCRGLANWLSHMGIDLLAYAVMGNHLHLVIRLRPDVVASWSEAEVARHALAILPVRSGPGLEPLRVTSAVLERYAGNARWVSQQRARLSSPSWLLRLVKQEIARRANAEDDCTGHFWESRFTSVVLLDLAATLACMVYVDLNPYRAHLVKDPTESWFTSIRHRHARTQGVRSDGEAPDSDLGKRLVAMPQCAPVDRWSGDLDDWSLSESDYVSLVRETAKVANRHGRAAVSHALSLVQRIGIEPSSWATAMAQGGSMSGSVIGGPEARERWCKSAGQRWAADKTGLW